MSAWITSIESPSNTALVIPSLVANDNAVTTASASTSELLKACGIFLEQEVNTEPEQSLITTPMPDLFSPQKIAPSKLIFTMFVGGAVQNLRVRAGLSLRADCVGWHAVNSAIHSLEHWGIWWWWSVVAEWFKFT